MSQSTAAPVVTVGKAVRTAPGLGLAGWWFQLGRLLGYSALGALAAASVQGLGWLGGQSMALRPLWSFFHVAAMLLGLWLMWSGQQPLWLQTGAQRLWHKARRWSLAGVPVTLVLGLLWALLPCGLLYSALMVAALAGQPLHGAVVMAMFALGSAVVLVAGPWLWLRLRGSGSGGWGSGAWGIRLSGAALAGLSAWALWMGLMHNTAPWCLPA